MTIQLEVGKRYVNRRGHVTGPLIKTTEGSRDFCRAYPFTDPHCPEDCWKPNGAYLDSDRVLLGDLTAEYVTPEVSEVVAVSGSDDGGKVEIVDESGSVIGTADTSNPKDLLGIKKPPLGLIPPAAEIHEAQAMKNGAAKYGPYNWRGKSVKASVYIDAALRHIRAWQDGEAVASDSGVHHLGHARASLGILLDAEATGNLIDDRPPAGAAAKLIASMTES